MKMALHETSYHSTRPRHRAERLDPKIICDAFHSKRKPAPHFSPNRSFRPALPMRDQHEAELLYSPALYCEFPSNKIQIANCFKQKVEKMYIQPSDRR